MTRPLRRVCLLTEARCTEDKSKCRWQLHTIKCTIDTTDAPRIWHTSNLDELQCRATAVVKAAGTLVAVKWVWAVTTPGDEGCSQTVSRPPAVRPPTTPTSPQLCLPPLLRPMLHGLSTETHHSSQRTTAYSDEPILCSEGGLFSSDTFYFTDTVSYASEEAHRLSNRFNRKRREHLSAGTSWDYF